MVFPSRPLGASLALATALASCEKEEGVSGAPSLTDFAIEESALPASEENPQVVGGDRFEDFHYAFTIDRPTPSWQFFTTEKAAAINPDAAMAMTKPGFGFVAVIAEPYDGDLAAYRDLLSDNGSLPTGELRATEIGGLPALRGEALLAEAGAQLRYRIALVQRGRFFYRILGWAPEVRWARVEGEIDAVVDSFRPVEGREPTVRASLLSPDSEGFGWWIRDRVYSNAASGVRVRCPEGCRLMGAAELLNMGYSGDCAGIAGGLGELYVIVLSEPMPETAGYDPAAATATQLGGTLAAPRKVSVGGRAADEYTVDGLDIDYRVVATAGDGLSHRVLAWWKPGDRGRALALLDDCYAAIDWLGETEAAELAGRLAKLDPGNATGVDFALRRGRFFDFGNGYELALPGGKIYRTETPATTEGEGPRVRFDDLRGGTGCEVYATALAAGADHGEYHRGELAHIETELETGAREVAGREFLVTHYEVEGEPTFSRAMASTPYGGGADRVIEFWLHLPGAGRRAELDAALEEIAAGLETPGDGVPEIVRGAGTIADRRLGYEVAHPSAWDVEHMAVPGMEAVGSMVSLEQRDVLAGFLGMCSPYGLQLDVAANGMINSIGVKVDGATMTQSPAKLAGLDAALQQFEGTMGGKRVKLSIWTAQRDNSGYVCFLIDGAKLPADAPAKIAGYVSLID